MNKVRLIPYLVRLTVYRRKSPQANKPLKKKIVGNRSQDKSYTGEVETFRSGGRMG